MTNSKANAVLVEVLGSSLRRGGSALADVPDLLKRLLSEEAWRDFVTQRGQTVHHERFEEFVVTPPLKGLGASVDLVRRVVGDDVEALDLLDRELRREHGGARHAGTHASKVDNINLESGGTSRTQALRRLRKDAPALHAEVLAGGLTAHAAMVKAGFRPRTATVRVDDPKRAASALRRVMSPEALAELVAALSSGE